MQGYRTVLVRQCLPLILLPFYTAPSHAMFLDLDAQKQCKTEDEVIHDYFFAPDNVIRFFKKGMGTEHFSEHPLEEDLSFQEYENKADQYRDQFKQYGMCSYAIESDDRILAGFSNSCILLCREAYGAQQRTVKIQMPPQSCPIYGQMVTTCRFVNNNMYLTDGLSHDMHNTSILVGYSNNQVHVWGQETGRGKLLFETKHIPLSIIDGYFQNTFIVKHNKGFSLIGLGKDGAYCDKCFLNIPSSAQLKPYQCGVVIKTKEKSTVLMPYSSSEYKSIKACNFSVEQKACLVRLIAAKKGGFKPLLQEAEKPHFAALPAVMQTMLKE